jgi:7,8-dihydropterin-6-yl-methyl-4-(beta-D-ribofuranosyl)aminobenzene 5'-phosphate synthase
MKSLGALTGKRMVPLVLHPAAFKFSRYLKMGPNQRIYFPRLTREVLLEAGFSPIETREPYLMMGDTALFPGEIPRKTDMENAVPEKFILNMSGTNLTFS